MRSSHREHPVDTSNIYTTGVSERLLGEAIARAGGLRDGKLIYSKADADADGTFDGDRIRRSLDESLERLGLDRLPIYHLHDPYTITFDEAMAPGGAVPALIELRESGVIGAIGIASGTMSQVHEYVASGVFDAVLSHNRFTLVDRMAQPTYELARSLGMTVFNAAPFGGGTLANGSVELRLPHAARGLRGAPRPRASPCGGARRAARRGRAAVHHGQRPGRHHRRRHPDARTTERTG